MWGFQCPSFWEWPRTEIESIDMHTASSGNTYLSLQAHCWGMQACPQAPAPPDSCLWKNKLDNYFQGHHHSYKVARPHIKATLFNSSAIPKVDSHHFVKGNSRCLFVVQYTLMCAICVCVCVAIESMNGIVQSLLWVCFRSWNKADLLRTCHKAQYYIDNDTSKAAYFNKVIVINVNTIKKNKNTDPPPKRQLFHFPAIDFKRLGFRNNTCNK